jgi:Fe-Mn family superoxide dismutase
MHTFPESQLDFASNEVPGLLSPAGFKLAWIDNQKLLIKRLNAMVGGTSLAQDTPRAIMFKTAHDPRQAHLFNHASMIFNNHFFFSGLTNKPSPMHPELQRELELCFGSIDNLRKEMTITALSMFGPGFVWLVRVFDKRLSKNTSEAEALRYDFRLLPTYLAGSPFAEAHWRRQGVDMNTSSEEQWRQGPLPGQPMAPYQTPTTPGGAKGSGDGAEIRDRIAPGGAHLVPLLCINTWEHVWLTDYGFGDGISKGKVEYVKRWWHVINWERVASLTMGPQSRQVA